MYSFAVYQWEHVFEFVWAESLCFDWGTILRQHTGEDVFIQSDLFFANADVLLNLYKLVVLNQILKVLLIRLLSILMFDQLFGELFSTLQLSDYIC